MPGQITIVIIDFRKERLSVMLDADEIMLTPGVVLVVEGIESLDLPEDRPLHLSASAFTPAVIMTRPPRKVVRKASFKARIFARLASLSSFSFSVLRTSTSVALPARQPCAGERDRGFPSSPLILSRRCRVGLDLPRPGWTGRDGRRQTRQGASPRHHPLSRPFFLGGDKADAAVAILALADFPELVFRAQLIEPGHKFRDRKATRRTRGTRQRSRYRERFRKPSRCSPQARCGR